MSADGLPTGDIKLDDIQPEDEVAIRWEVEITESYVVTKTAATLAEMFDCSVEELAEVLNGALADDPEDTLPEWEVAETERYTAVNDRRLISVLKVKEWAREQLPPGRD